MLNQLLSGPPCRFHGSPCLVMVGDLCTAVGRAAMHMQGTPTWLHLCYRTLRMQASRMRYLKRLYIEVDKSATVELAAHLSRVVATWSMPRPTRKDGRTKRLHGGDVGLSLAKFQSTSRAMFVPPSSKTAGQRRMRGWCCRHSGGSTPSPKALSPSLLTSHRSHQSQEPPPLDRAITQ